MMPEPSEMSEMSDGNVREPLDGRFPRLKDIDAMNDEQRIGTFREVLADLQRELDGIGK